VLVLAGRLNQEASAVDKCPKCSQRLDNKVQANHNAVNTDRLFLFIFVGGHLRWFCIQTFRVDREKNEKND